MAAELGQTTNPRELIPGDPEAITNDLRTLAGNLQGMDAIKSDLSGINPQQWTGAASDAFRTVFGTEPAKWADAINAVGQNAQSLADFGQVLAWGQGEAQRAIEQYTQAQAASRAAVADYNARAQSAVGQALAPFQDPGQAAAQAAQQILANARDKIAQAGGLVAQAFGMEQEDDGSYSKSIGDDKKFGADSRKTTKKWDPEKKQWVDEDPGGWQQNKGGKSFSKEWGDQSDGMLTDKLKGLMDTLGIVYQDEDDAVTGVGEEPEVRQRRPDPERHQQHRENGP